jgi:hypothetical protein
MSLALHRSLGGEALASFAAGLVFPPYGSRCDLIFSSETQRVADKISKQGARAPEFGGKSLARFAAKRGDPFFPYTIPLTEPPRGGREPMATGEGNALLG